MSSLLAKKGQGQTPPLLSKSEPHKKAWLGGLWADCPAPLFLADPRENGSARSRVLQPPCAHQKITVHISQNRRRPPTPSESPNLKRTSSTLQISQDVQAHEEGRHLRQGKLSQLYIPRVSCCDSCRPADTGTLVRHKVRDPTSPNLPPDLLSTTCLLLVPDWSLEELAPEEFVGVVAAGSPSGERRQLAVRALGSQSLGSSATGMIWQIQKWRTAGYMALQTDLGCSSAWWLGWLETDRDTSSRAQQEARGHDADCKLRYGASLRKLVKSESYHHASLVGRHLLTTPTEQEVSQHARYTCSM